MKKRKFDGGGYTDQEAADLMERNIVPKRESIRLTSDEPATKQSAADQAAEDAAVAREARRSMPVAKPVAKPSPIAPKLTPMMRDDAPMSMEAKPASDYSDQNSRSVRGEKRFTGKETAAESDMIDRINASAKEQKAKKMVSDNIKSIADMESGYPKEKAPVYNRGDMGRNGPIGDLVDIIKSNRGKVPQRSGSRYSGQDGGSGLKYKSGGSVASKRGDGIAQRGKTKGKMC